MTLIDDPNEFAKFWSKALDPTLAYRVMDAINKETESKILPTFYINVCYCVERVTNEGNFKVSVCNNFKHKKPFVFPKKFFLLRYCDGKNECKAEYKNGFLTCKHSKNKWVNSSPYNHFKVTK